MNKTSVFRFAAATLLLGALVGVSSGAGAAQLAHAVVCSSAAQLDITPANGGATYSLSSGAGWCVQGIPYQGDWSVTYSGTGSATSFSCTAIGGTVSGLKLNVTLSYHNNRNGNSGTVAETWTQILPVGPYGLVAFTVNPGGNIGLLQTHIFNQCPPSGTPAAYIEWTDGNAPA